MKSIIFWNVEHISQHALDIADRAATRERRTLETKAASAVRHAAHGPTPAIRRSHLMHGNYAVEAKIRRKQQAERTGRANRAAQFANNRGLNAEIAAGSAMQTAESKARQLLKKFKLSQDLPTSANDVFFCEVVATHPDARSSQAGAAAPGGAVLCYARYSGGINAGFTHCPVTLGWCNAPAQGTRVPKSVTITGHHGPVHFCFWHAPSGNNGTVVAQMYADLVAHGAPFVLFGDLNTEPNQLITHHVPPVNILQPPAGTRISNRCLDYAVTNVPGYFHGVRALYPQANGWAIKQRTGSDHMVMILDMK